MKFQDLAESNDPAPKQDIVDKFADVDAKTRTWYISQWADKKGIKSDDAMHMAGYIRDGYIGAGAWNWRYVGMDESIQEAEQEMIGEPDSYYDEEDRKQAYNELQDALDQHPSWAHDSIKDGICPDCAGNSCMDGDYENGEDSCDGSGNYGCDEGEMEYRNGECSWVEIIKHDERQAEKANRGPAPDKEAVMKVLPRLHDDYVKSGRFNAMALPSILRQMYPELNKRVAGSYVADFFKTFEESTQQIDEGDSDEVMVAKMLAKALGDPNRWTEMSAPELYAELESTNPDVADMISKVAKMLYDVKLEERAYKDVGVADTVKDQRGKEFNFDKGSKKFKSQDGEEADVTTKLGKDLMRIRKNQMKKTTPSYKTKKNQGIMASIEESYGEDHEITLEDNEDFNDVFGVLGYSLCEQDTFEAEYQGRKVKLNKPMQGDTKKFKVYVKDPKTGNVKKVNFGHGGSSVKGKAMKIRKSNPKARKSFRARHNCSNPGPKTKARYWSCRKW